MEMPMTILEEDYDRMALQMAKSIKHAEDAQTRVEVRLNQFKAGMMMRTSDA
jgi:hypothetical protein